MGVRTIDREPRLKAALQGLAQARSRSVEIPAALVERQPRDHRVMRKDSTKPVAVLASVKALSEGLGVAGATAAATGGTSGGYYSGGGAGGGGEFDDLGGG